MLSPDSLQSRRRDSNSQERPYESRLHPVRTAVAGLGVEPSWLAGVLACPASRASIYNIEHEVDSWSRPVVTNLVTLAYVDEVRTTHRHTIRIIIDEKQGLVVRH